MDKQLKKIGKNLKKTEKEVKHVEKLDKSRDKQCEYGKEMMKKKK